MMEMLKRVPCFTDAEPFSTKMSDLFPLTKRILVNLGEEPPVFVSTRLPFSTPEFVISRIQLLLDYTVQETTEVVTSFVLPHFLIMYTLVSDTNFVSVVTFSWWPTSATWCISTHYFFSNWR